jgi:biotin carboxylase
MMLDFILVGSSVRIALPVLQALHCAGPAHCAVVGSAPTAVLRWSHLCRQHVVMDFDQDDAAVHQINLLAQQHPRAVLLPFDCEAIRFVNRVQGRLRLGSIPVPDLATLNMFDDKWAFHQFCLANALPVPLTRWIGPKSNLDFDAIEAELGLPFVVKPTNESGSHGVQIVHSRAQLERNILGNSAYQFSPLIAQRYIQGVDMDINLFAVDGQLRAVSIHQPGQSYIDFLPHPPLEAIADAVCLSSRYNGVMNLDVRLASASGEVFLIESNPRFWATLTSTVDCGLNFAAASLQRSSVAELPQRLVAGRSYSRHPFLRPSCWWQLVSDSTEKGRLLRAKAFDLYSLGQLLLEVPAIVKRRLQGLRSVAASP